MFVSLILPGMLDKTIFQTFPSYFSKAAKPTDGWSYLVNYSYRGKIEETFLCQAISYSLGSDATNKWVRKTGIESRRDIG